MTASFRALLEKAIRTESDDSTNSNNSNHTGSQDWSPHCVDYAGFKHMLKAMARRRAKLRKMIRQEADHKLPEPIVQQALQEFLTPQHYAKMNQETRESKSHEPNPNDTSFLSEATADSSQIAAVAAAAATCGPILTTATTATATTVAMKPSRSWKAQQQQQQQSKSQTSLSIAEEGEEDPNITTTTPYFPLSDSDGLALQTQQQQAQQQHQQQYDAPQPQQEQQCQDPLTILLHQTLDQANAAHQHLNDDASESMQSVTSSFASHSTATGTRQRRRIKRKSKRNVLRKLSTHERSEMVRFIQLELNKVQMFYLSQWQRLSGRLEEFSLMTTATLPTGNNYRTKTTMTQHDADDDDGLAPPQEQPSADSYYLDDHVLGQEILELYAFCTMNIVATCQILIRYDAYARTFEGTPMMEYFLKLVTKHPTSFRKILQHEELTALADSFQLLVNASSAQPGDDEDNTAQPSILMTSFEQQRQMFKNVLDSTYSAQSVASLQHVEDNMTDSFIRTLRSWVEFGAYEDRLGLEPAYLTMRGKSLTAEMKQLADWRERQGATTAGGRAADEPPPEPKPQLSDVQKFNLTLNLLSAFLYCMNYYIVEPSSTMYVNRLGAHDAMSGTLIGMMPLAAFISSIPFSMWTNHSFRYPFIMSCSLMVTGNVLYSLADQVRMVEVALLGRFIAGLGAPKCIIRRYMADTTPVKLRTSVNAGFGMVVAAGSALGPAMAVILSRVEYMSDPLPVVGVIFFNGLTMPGYFMATLWTTFLLIVLLTFDEPNRAGLAEQVQMEMMSNLNTPKKEKDEENEDDDDESMEEPLRPTTYEPPGVFRPNQGALSTDDIHTIFSKDTDAFSPTSGNVAGDSQGVTKTFSGEMSIPPFSVTSGSFSESPSAGGGFGSGNVMSLRVTKLYRHMLNFLELVTFPVRICLGLLFAKVFTIEALASATSALSKNRYHWQVRQVGMLGFTNGCLVIPFSILVGRLSLSYQDQKLMLYLVAIGCFGFFLLIDLSDLVDAGSSGDYNKGHPLAVGPKRYVTGYFLSYLSIQAFEGVIGSTLSKVIPTALASGTFNSGLLATLVDTAGRACGDLFISAVGFISLRQLMNLLFIPAFGILLTCLIVIERNRDLLAV
mmetsp:Transcript_20176/g.55705  ORF Transcript_20176/g.55705 Transcript_20176/m.55705 type:complete len:1122 (-) Transcript_20176:3667-7032(-)|eukprot:CAMPEP_0168744644 /NCGR_PEP_ID=MMETSP0724-20121128/14200_1 /TAXON_ID=265536 /ORGANISM="Amphiprora sp., Strain CCMP467" /LENGTH=1121 /DNA_ID=CAMNT_0008792315 /DNA_START=25 /DNA_END=3390 /DNA_ORIENTATION=-